jgi:Clp amino terminal domain, pathogenicity island component
VIWRRVVRLLAASVGEDGTRGIWERLTPDSREVIGLAYAEARELGHPCLADEHVLLGLLGQGSSPAAGLLRSTGLDLDTARAELERVGPTLGRRVDPAAALRTLGIEMDQVKARLEATFGPDTVRAAERRVRRRPRWRGGHARPSPLCVYILAKRSMQFAAEFADRRGEAGITPEHLLYGVLQDARDPLGTQLSRRSRRELAGLGWTAGRPNPSRLLLEARGIDLTGLAAALGRPH